MKISTLLLGICALFYVATVQAVVDPACNFWNTLAYNLTHASEQNGGVLQFACNNTCNSISCTGRFKAPPIFRVNFEEDLCFGLRLDHCSKPLALNYYVIVPKNKINSSGSITHNDSFDLPGPEVYGIPSTIGVIVEMVKVNATTVKFGINTNVKASIGGLPAFQDKEKVLPEMYITVPPCTSNTAVIPAFKVPSVCTSLPTQEPPTTKKGITTLKPVTTTRKYKSCEIGVGNCGVNEMCKATHDDSPARSGICVCHPGARYDAVTKQCNAFGTTTLQPSTAKKSTKAPTTGPSVTVSQTGKKKGGKINMTAVIIGAVFGGLLLIVVVVSVIVFLGRRRRQANYRGRHQLLSDDDDDDNDTNVVI